MNVEANFEWEVEREYYRLEKQIRGHFLEVVDLHGCDILDAANNRDCCEFLHNIEIEVEALSLRASGHLGTEIAELLVLARVTLRRLEEWGRVEERFVRCLLFHAGNEELEPELVGGLVELHRKLIKSYDIDNSIVFVSKNIIMDSYLGQLKEELTIIEQKITEALVQARADYPRLCLLSD